MNKVILIGRLTRPLELRYSNDLAMLNMNLAVDRKFKREGAPTADFINCKAFGKTAEFIEKYFDKGHKIAIVGRIETGSYKNKDGNTVYTTDVIVEEAEFVEKRGESSGEVEPKPVTDSQGFMDIPDDVAEELPFN